MKNIIEINDITAPELDVYATDIGGAASSIL